MTTFGDLVYQLGGVPVSGAFTTGNVFFVDSGTGNNGFDGKKPSAAFATLDYAIGKCTADNGDIIYVLPGHSEAPAAEITVDIANLSIIGLGSGKNRPKFAGAHTGDLMAIDADDVVVENIYFAASTAANTAHIDINAAQATIKNCLFEQGASNGTSITVTASGIAALITGCEFHVTANGPDICIDIESGTASDLHVIDNYFNGGSTTNAWDTGCILSAVANTDVLIKDNVFMHGASNIGHIQFTTSTVTGVISNNMLGGGTIAQMLDPGGCMCFENYEADAVDQSGRLFPTTAAS